MDKKGDDVVCLNCGWVDGTMPDSPLFLIPGTVLQGKYLIGRVLGQGGFGITYLGWDMFLGLKLAIKEYFPQQLASRAAGHSIVSAYSGSLGGQYEYGLDKFLQEARTLAQFEEHPGIVSVRDYFQDNGTAYIVMGYIEGITFKNYLADHSGKLTFAETMKILSPILDALREVHSANILHRDISPDNIYINRSGQVVLIDFGAARQAISEKGHSLSVILKPGYTPEEQYRSSGVQGPWTDLYALAATIYRAITGTMPPESLDRMVNDTIEAPSVLGAEIAGYEEKVLLKALAVRAEERYRSIEEFSDAFKQGHILSESEDEVKPLKTDSVPVESEPTGFVAAPVFSEPEDAKRVLPAKGKAKRLPIILGSALLLLALSGAAYSFFSQPAKDILTAGLDRALEIGETVLEDPDSAVNSDQGEEGTANGADQAESGQDQTIFDEHDDTPFSPVVDPPATVVDNFIGATLLNRYGSGFDYDYAKELMTRAFAARFTSSEFIPRIYGFHDGPTDYVIISEDITGSGALVTVHGYWDLTIGRQWDFSLTQQNDRWLISAIKALPGPQEEESFVEDRNYVIVDVSVLRLRQGPGTDYEIIGRLDRGTKLEVIDFSEEWLLVITPDGDSGWVHSGYVR